MDARSREVNVTSDFDRYPIRGGRAVLLSAFLAMAPMMVALAQSQNAGSCLGQSATSTTTCINNLISAVPAPGGEVYFPAGTYPINGSLNMRNGVDLRGEGRYATTVLYSGSGGSAVNGLGSPSQRIIFTISDMTFDGTPATVSADGIILGDNQRSNPLLQRVRIVSFPRYGIHFAGENWDLSFDHTEISTNGMRVTNGSGVFKDVSFAPPSVPDLNAVSFNSCLIEGNGSSSSAAGGVFLQSTSSGPMKQIVFRDSVIEENVGSDQLFVAYASGLVLDGVYGESDEPHDAQVLFEIDHSSGTVSGTRVAIGPATGSYPQSIGIKVTSSPNMVLDTVVYSGPWGANTVIQ
jgi:Pectate lyase superfamily protein